MFFLEGREINVGDAIYTCIYVSRNVSPPPPTCLVVKAVGRKYITLEDEHGNLSREEVWMQYDGKRSLSADRYSWEADRWSITHDAVNLRFELMRCIDNFQIGRKTKAQHLQQIQRLKTAINALKEEVN